MWNYVISCLPCSGTEHSKPFFYMNTICHLERKRKNWTCHSILFSRIWFLIVEGGKRRMPFQDLCQNESNAIYKRHSAWYQILLDQNDWKNFSGQIPPYHNISLLNKNIPGVFFIFFLDILISKKKILLCVKLKVFFWDFLWG